MPHFIDVHHLPGITTEIAAAEHIRDIDVQGPYAVNYSKYWLNEETGKLFCYCEAPTAEAAIEVHRLAHGDPADNLIEVTPELLELFLGTAGFVDTTGAVMLSAVDRDHDTVTRTILFTDIVGSTALTQRLGDEAAMAILTAHDDIVLSALTEHGGREVKHTGDGIMAVFVSAVGAVRCAIDAQRALARYSGDGADEPIEIRIGIASGEPVGRNGDLFGATVQLAARLCAHAGPSQIVVSGVVADLCLGKRLRFEELGSVALKGFPVDITARLAAWE